MKEFITNVIQPFKNSIVYKSVKKGQTSFRITQQLIQSVYNKSKKLNSFPVLILTIPANENENYYIRCQITKEKK
jgi:hypothetical protein